MDETADTLDATHSANLDYLAGRYGAAQEGYKAALRTAGDDEVTIILYSNLAAVALKCDDFVAAEEAAQQSLCIRYTERASVCLATARAKKSATKSVRRMISQDEPQKAQVATMQTNGAVGDLVESSRVVATVSSSRVALERRRQGPFASLFAILNATRRRIVDYFFLIFSLPRRRLLGYDPGDGGKKDGFLGIVF